MGRRRLGAAAAVCPHLPCRGHAAGQARESRIVFLGDVGHRRLEPARGARPDAALPGLPGLPARRQHLRARQQGPDRVALRPGLPAGDGEGDAVPRDPRQPRRVVPARPGRLTIEPLPDDADAYRWDILRCDVKAQLTHRSVRVPRREALLLGAHRRRHAVPGRGVRAGLQHAAHVAEQARSAADGPRPGRMAGAVAGARPARAGRW